MLQKSVCKTTKPIGNAEGLEFCCPKMIFLQRCRITIFSISVSGRSYLALGKAAYFWDCGVFIRNKILFLPEQSCGIASFAVFKASAFKVIILKQEKQKQQKPEMDDSLLQLFTA